MYHAILHFPDEGVLCAGYWPESRRDERTEVAVKKEKKGCMIEVASSDALSFRASMATLIKLLGVYEKIKAL